MLTKLGVADLQYLIDLAMKQGMGSGQLAAVIYGAGATIMDRCRREGELKDIQNRYAVALSNYSAALAEVGKSCGLHVFEQATCILCGVKS